MPSSTGGAQISLPRGRAGGVGLSSRLGDEAYRLVEQTSDLLRSPSDAADALAEIGEAQAMGPVLCRRGYDYGNFLELLHDRGILELSSDISCVCGLFFVRK